MLTYRVDDMTCGHCAATITNALHVLDSGIRVQTDLTRHLVQVEATQAQASRVAAAIAEAGYAPVAVDASPADQPRAQKGGCCGCCG